MGISNISVNTKKHISDQNTLLKEKVSINMLTKISRACLSVNSVKISKINQSINPNLFKNYTPQGQILQTSSRALHQSSDKNGEDELDVESEESRKELNEEKNRKRHDVSVHHHWY